MPIRIPDALPATAALESENIFVMTEFRALHQDIRPLRVLILNLMPTKIATETQIMRKLSNTPVSYTHLELADEHQVPAYIICSDATLRGMCRKRPATREELLDVPGIGEKKADAYGAAFLLSLIHIFSLPHARAAAPRAGRVCRG